VETTNVEEGTYIVFRGSENSFIYPLKAGKQIFPNPLPHIMSYELFQKNSNETKEIVLEGFNLETTLDEGMGNYPTYTGYTGMSLEESTLINSELTTNELFNTPNSLLNHVSFLTEGTKFTQNYRGIYFDNIGDHEISLDKVANDQVVFNLEKPVNIQEIMLKGSRYLQVDFFDGYGNLLSTNNPQSLVDVVQINNVEKIVVKVADDVPTEFALTKHVLYQVDFKATNTDGTSLSVDELAGKLVIDTKTGLYDSMNSKEAKGFITDETVTVIYQINDWTYATTSKGNFWLKEGYTLNKRYTSNKSGMYKNQNSISRIGFISPQFVDVLQVGENGWIQINSWMGPVWIKDGHVKDGIYLTKKTGMFTTPGGSLRKGVLAPQLVSVIEKRSDGWVKIETYLGAVWVKDGQLDSVTYLTKKTGMFTTPGGKYQRGIIQPQRVIVLETRSDGWVKIKTYLGNLWVKNGVFKK
jgi:hypothetical protein